MLLVYLNVVIITLLPIDEQVQAGGQKLYCSVKNSKSMDTKQTSIGKTAIVQPINPRNRKKIEANEMIKLDANKDLANPYAWKAKSNTNQMLISTTPKNKPSVGVRALTPFSIS